ncbi:MAG: MBL fold metallo-hydrolase [Bacillota bacterium]|nr:MBL fold metallo-hydrolase [Bacillota bacterium]
MQLEKINGNSYYIPAPTNIGVFQFKDKYTLLIDSGDNKQQARKIDELVQDRGLMIKHIANTHSHSDHAGGNLYFQEHYPGCLIYASAEEQFFIENGTFFSTYLYGASPIKELSRHFLKAHGNIIHSTLEPGTSRINDEKFEVISLPGHALGSIALGTRDRVCYLGDALFSEEIIEKYSMPFLFDIEAQLRSYDRIAELDYDFFVLSHAAKIYSQAEIIDLININRANVKHYLGLSLELMAQPKTREELLEELSILKDLHFDFKEYYFSLSTTGAIIAYLYHREQLDYQIESGKLYYYQKG